MKVLILGGGGMLGHQLYRTLSERHEPYATLRRFEGAVREHGGFDERRLHVGIDALDAGAVGRVLAEVRPSHVINCVGIIKQSSEAKDEERCLEVNADLPHRLARQTEEVGARLIHLSTDCVFTGARGDYTEADASDATDVYGRTKYLGEVATETAMTIRTSIVGTSLTDNVSLFDWFLSQGRNTVKGFTKAIFTGLTTRYLAKEIERIIERGFPAGGLWHVSAEKIAKYDLLLQLKEAFGSPTEVVPDDQFTCDRSLDSSRYQTATGFAPPSWEAMIKDYVADRRTTYGWKNDEPRK